MTQGPFPKFFAKQKRVVRTRDPMSSVAGLGPSVKGLFSNLPPTSFGKDSLFERLLHHPRTKCVSIGLGPNWIPFLHYLDWKAGVPFRFDKLFFGGINIDGKIHHESWVYSVRVGIPESIADGHKLGDHAVTAGIWRYTSLGRARVYACDYGRLFNFSLKMVKDNNWLTAKGPPCDVLARGRDLKSITRASPLHKNRRSTGRHILGDDVPRILGNLQKDYPFKLSKFISGDQVFDWLIPEEKYEHVPDSFVGELQIAEWCLSGEISDTVLLCCYLDRATDRDLNDLSVLLDIMKRLDEQESRRFTYRLAAVPGTVGYAAFLTTIPNVDVFGALHVVKFGPKGNLLVQRACPGDNKLEKIVSKWILRDGHSRIPPRSMFDPQAPGLNPLSERTLMDLSFDNIVVTTTEDTVKNQGPAVLTNNDYLYELIQQLESAG